jgi:acyl-homoserine lactone acylase PvdQ
MAQSLTLDLFLERIMNMNLLRMGGASAGIFGSSGADTDILNRLKNTTITFANEYRKPKEGHAKLVQLSKDIYGYFQTLQLTNTLSEKEANKLIDQLDKLTDLA